MTTAGTVTDANASRNAARRRGRRARWAPARDALWTVLDGLLPDHARVAIVGAGNGDDLPLARIAARASTVTLLDLDPDTAERARGRVRRGLRRRIRVLAHDATGGAADRILRSAVAPPGAGAPDDAHADAGGTVADARSAGAPGGDPPSVLPGGPYDVVVGDLLYSQLLYPALLDAGVPPERRRAILGAEGPDLTRSVVRALHDAAPVVVHVHDLACWGNGYAQPVDLETILEAAERDPVAALELAGRTKGPREADPRTAVTALGRTPAATALWRWPFVEGVDYLVVATVVGGTPPADGTGAASAPPDRNGGAA